MRFGSRTLGYLMSVVGGGQSSTDVEELADAQVGGQVLHDAGEKQPDAAGDLDHDRHGGEDIFGSPPVGGEIVLAAQPVVVDARRVSHGGVEGDGARLVPVGRCLTQLRRRLHLCADMCESCYACIAGPSRPRQ